MPTKNQYKTRSKKRLCVNCSKKLTPKYKYKRCKVCIEKHRKTNKNWRDNNKEYPKSWRDKNKEKSIEYVRKYRRNNREFVNKHQLEYYYRKKKEKIEK